MVIQLLANQNTDRWQGFDEFMNLVIDDAVEVKLVSKTNDKESRRSLGESRHLSPWNDI